MRNRKKKQGFTLVELMIVAVIVAILAAVAIPLMSANKKRAIATEAEAGCGTIRTVLRAMRAESGAYNKDLDGTALAASQPDVTVLPGLSSGDLDGKYFGDDDYAISGLGADAYTITCTGYAGYGDGEAAGIVIQLNQAGTWVRTLP